MCFVHCEYCCSLICLAKFFCQSSSVRAESAFRASHNRWEEPMTTNDLVAVVSLLHASAFCRGTAGLVANARLARSCSFYSRQSGDAEASWLLPCAVYPRHHQSICGGGKGI